MMFLSDSGDCQSSNSVRFRDLSVCGYDLACWWLCVNLRVFNRWPSTMDDQPKPSQTLRSNMPHLHLLLLCRIILSISAVLFWHSPVLREICENRRYYSRNSYRCRKYHIYETVKLNQIEKWKLDDYSESEKIYKAFVEHDSVWALIVQSYFLWQPATAW